MSGKSIKTKELLKEVLGLTKEARIMFFDVDYREVIYDILSPINGHYQEKKNTYELAFEYKEWAITEHKLNIYPFKTELGWQFDISYDDFHSCNYKAIYEGISTNEPDALFDACEWIYKNKKTKELLEK